jgi:hypothetical protein
LRVAVTIPCPRYTSDRRIVEVVSCFACNTAVFSQYMIRMLCVPYQMHRLFRTAASGSVTACKAERCQSSCNAQALASLAAARVKTNTKSSQRVNKLLPHIRPSIDPCFCETNGDKNKHLHLHPQTNCGQWRVTGGCSAMATERPGTSAVTAALKQNLHSRLLQRLWQAGQTNTGTLCRTPTLPPK